MTAGDVSTNISYPRGFNSNRFDGVDDYVEIPHNEAQLGKNLSNGFTISAWINARSLGEGTGRIIDKSSAGNTKDGFALSTGGTNTFLFGINESASITPSNSVVVFGTWQHILITINSQTKGTFYINGVANGTANQQIAQTLDKITATSVMHIGNRALLTDRTFDGSIRSVKMWNKVLTTAEIAQDYAGTTPAQDNLLYNFKLGGDYNNYGIIPATATNSGSVPVIQEDQVASSVKAIRGLTGISGAFLLCPVGRKREQLLQVGIQQT